MSVCLRLPDSASHTRILVSNEPDTTWTPSNCGREQYFFLENQSNTKNYKKKKNIKQAEKLNYKMSDYKPI